MITIDLGTLETFNPETSEFEYEEGGVVRFEYSLRVLYNWEGRWKKPFLKSKNLSDEEVLDFYREMAIDDFEMKFLTSEVCEVLANYIADPQTATRFSNYESSQNGNKSSGSGKMYTSEELYAMMVMSNVPLEWEDRNLNRLITMLKIIADSNAPKKKMNRSEIYKQNAEINRARKEKMKSKG